MSAAFQGAPAPIHRRGARTPRPQRRRHYWRSPSRPVRLHEIEAAILDAIATGPKTAGELLSYHLGGLKAEIRDEAIESLLRHRRAKLIRIPHTSLRHGTMLAVALPGEVDRV